jgi:DNA-binding NarL/FixJ family response regulator
MPPIRILLADDHPGFSAGLRGHLDREPDLDVVAVASDGDRALALARQHRPDVLVLDMEMPGRSGLEVARALRTLDDPPVQVLVLSAYEDEEYIFGILDAGAAGYLSKQEPLRAIAEAIRGAARGETGWLSRKIAALYVRRHRETRAEPPTEAQAHLDALTEREREVLGLVARGLTNADLADALFIAESTAKKHVHALYAKLPADTRAQLVAWAWRHDAV